jgi:hypothetical protein
LRPYPRHSTMAQFVPGPEMTLMRKACFLSAAALLLAAAPVRAADLPVNSATLPTFALDPSLSNTGWSGWTFGAGVTAVGIKGWKGQFGGDTFLAYDHLFANDVALSVQFDTGYAPNLAPWKGVKGFDYATISATTVFNASSRFRPYLTTSASVAHSLTSAWNGNPMNAYDTLNGVFGNGGYSQTLGSVGAGFAYDVTPNSTIFMGVQAGNGVALAPAFLPGY